MTAITPELMVELLNEAYVADTQAVTALVSQHIPCGKALDSTPTVVAASESGISVGLLGVLNGILIKAGESRRIAGIFREDGRLEGFCLTPATGGFKTA